MRMSLQYQYMLDMEKERSHALFKCYDFRGEGGQQFKVTIKSG